jgi:hypothetical protein
MALTAAATLLPAASLAQEAPKLTIGGTTYTKWLYGNQRYQGALYNFTTIPGEGYGDNGVGTELELLLSAKLSSAVEVRGRIHSRFSQNFWTNFGGFGGTPDAPNSTCSAGNCGEFDPRSNQYVKLRGMSVILTPGYLIDSATIGANDFGQFDPIVLGRIRYIDRDNANGVLLQSSALDRKLTWDAAAVALPRLWAGPRYITGQYHATDAAYVFQGKYSPLELLDVGGIFQYVNDAELNSTDTVHDNGRDLYPRYRNFVGGVKAGIHLGPTVDVSGRFYRSYSHAEQTGRFPETPKSYGLNGYSPVPAGKNLGNTWMVDVALSDPLDMGLSLNIQGFSIGGRYASIMAARRESDVLLTEGHDGSFSLPGPNNAAYGVFRDPTKAQDVAGNNATSIGYGGWTGESQQVATINVDNEFTDFDEPFAETAIGWQGVTFNPVYTNGALDLSGEYSFIGYNTNWQAWGSSDRAITDTLFPAADLDTGVGHNFRSAYQPFQEKQTHIAVLKARYSFDIGRGLDVFGKFKYIHENDKRLNDERYLPFRAGVCSNNPENLGCVTDPAELQNFRNEYSPGLSTADVDYFKNPNVISVVNPLDPDAPPQRGYQFKPFDNVADDDRELDYTSFNLGVGSQVTDDLYLSLAYTKYMADLLDGNTAFQAYNLHEMASGKHDKNLVALKAKYILAGVEFGLEGQYLFGSFTPDFGTGFLPSYADAATSAKYGVALNSRGFFNRYGGWNSLETRNFEQVRLKAFMKAQF